MGCIVAMFACPQAIIPINGENRMPVGVEFVVEMQFSAAIPKRRVRPTRRSDIVRGMGRRGRGNSRCDSLWAHRCEDRSAASPAGPYIARAHVCTPVTNLHLVCRLLLVSQ